MGSGSGEITGIMQTAGEVVSGSFGFVSDAISAITGNPLILLCVLMPFVAVGIKLVKKLISVKAGRGA